MDRRKNVIVTGASGDIGSAIASRYANEGCNVAIIGGKNKDALDALKRELVAKAADSTILDYSGDLGSQDFCKSIVDNIIGEFKNIDILVNCAGVSVVKLLQDTTTSDWNTVIGSNLTSVYNICHEIVPHMVKEQTGKILNISSVWGQHGASMEVAYSASKGGVDAFTKALAKELAPSNIAVNALSLGFVDTKMNKHLNEDELNCIIEEIPAGRLADTGEIADAVYKLTTFTGYMTGQIITVDGGWTV